MPVSGAQFAKYGGHTSCVEVSLASGHSILFDAGTGLTAYDHATPADKKSRVICFTHAHYDHVQGLPFYSRAFLEGSPLLILGPDFDAEKNFRNSMEQFFDGVHTPFTWDDLPAHQIRGVRPGEKFDLFGASLETCPTIHHGGCLAWKITADGWTFALTGDHEIPLDKRDLKKNLRNERLMSFLSGSDVVLADGQFTSEHRASRPGTGHSSPGQWQKELQGRDVGRIYFTHFHPAYADRIVDELAEEAKGGPITAGVVFDGAIINQDGLAREVAPIECPGCEFNRKVAGFSDTHSILDALLTFSRKQVNAEGGTVYLVAGGELNFAAAQNDVLFPESAESKYAYFNSRLPLSKSSIAGYVASTGESLNIPNVRELPWDSEYKFNPELDLATGYHTTSILAVPLKNGSGQIVGVLQLINRKGLSGYEPFSETMAQDATRLAQMATIPLERSFLVIAMILRLLKTASLRDPSETAAHVRRVGSMAAELYHFWASKHKVDPEEILFSKGQLRLAAMLHDVGKVGVPDAVLTKVSKLTDQERIQMEQHACLGASLFGTSKHVIDNMARDITMHHHARWDGAGYTGRKDVPSPSGPEIPVWARITAIADAYDTLVTPHPFKKVWTPREALAFLRHEAGKHFDPELVEDFRQIQDVVKSIYERFPDEE